MTDADITAALAKHLPPSAAALRLLDVGGRCASTLAELRPDVVAETVPFETWAAAANSIDAVMALDVPLQESFLAAALAVLRPGGRLMIALSGVPDERYVQLLEREGYARILVEPLPAPADGVLVRGEKPHTTADTMARIEPVAAQDDAFTDFGTYRGRFVYLLVRQTPNKPVWALKPDEVIQWQAAALEGESLPTLLVFSSLPRAVGFMQPAVLQGRVTDVNKVAKFSRETAATWTYPALLNPELDALPPGAVVWIEMDPSTAAASDE